MRDKLTPFALRWAQSRVASPVLIEAEPRSLRELFLELAPYTEEVLETFPRLLGIMERIEPFASPIRSLDRFNMLSAYLPREIIFSLAERRGIEKIYADQMMSALYQTVSDDGVYTAKRKIAKEVTFTTTEHTRKLIGADIANSRGFTGDGVLVAITDTGASRVHEQIRRVVFESAMGQVRDENGHGTWCTTCIGGEKSVDEVMSRTTGKTIQCEGMAPGCDLLAIKCLGFFIGIGSTSSILEAISRAIDRKANVISMSLGGDAQGDDPKDDPYYSVMQKVVDAGIIPAIAAGNSGPDENTVNAPGNMPQVLTVGAYDPIDGKIAEFSSRGPTNWGDVKPDVIAPGVDINSGIVGVLDTSGDGKPSRYSPLSGTSMATPHVAGLVACMMQAHRKLVGQELTVDEIKTMMQQLGTQKTNVAGWGPITWPIYERWLSTEHSVKVKV